MIRPNSWRGLEVHPSGMSCPDCFTGTLHEGTPVGRVEVIHGLPTYTADPPSRMEPAGIIVIISDAFGWDLPNSRVLADAYAKFGYIVHLPDFLGGHCLPHALLQDINIVITEGFAEYGGEMGAGRRRRCEAWVCGQGRPAG